MSNNIIIGITGASGSIYGLRILEELKNNKNFNTHLIISSAAHITVKQELDFRVKLLQQLANCNYNYNDISASIASGSFKTRGMIIAPCSIKTMSEIATGNTGNLLSRAADVVLKERRKLLILLRETPLNSIHIENMKRLSDAGAIIFPPVPAFYLKPKTIDELVNHTVARVLDIFDIETPFINRWQGIV